MIILGLDPGTTRIGYGIVKKERGNLTCLDYGLISSTDKSGVALVLFIENLNKLISQFNPEIAAIEKLFFFKNKKTVIEVSEMRGVIRAILTQNNIPYNEFTPLQVKQSVSSYGRAGKDQVEKMVRIILNIKDPIRPDDAADGLAIAICCANTILE